MTQTTPHPRTLRKARETIKSMVTHGFATQSIKNYLSRWCSWWAKTNSHWSYQQFLAWFIETTYQGGVRLIAKRLWNDKFCTSEDTTASAISAGKNALAQAAL